MTADGDYPRFSDEEFARRHAETTALMERTGCDVLILFGTSTSSGTGQGDIYWLSHHMGKQENILVLIAGQDPVLLVESFNHVPNALRQTVIKDTRYGGPKPRFAQTLVDLLHQRDAPRGRIGIVGLMPYQVYNELMAALPGSESQDLTREFRVLRLRKSAEELEWLRRGAARTDAALESMVGGMKPGMKEYQLGALLADGYREQGGEDYLHYISSTPQDASDRCVPAQTPSNRTLARGDVLLMELSVGYRGYAGQTLRSIILDATPNKLYSELHDTALAAYDGMLSALRPGATTEDVLTACDVIDERGYEIIDGLLHGYAIGVLPPSVPGEAYPTTLSRPVRMGQSNGGRPFTFEEGHTVVLQPNVVTKDCQAGVQMGNLVVVTATGAEPLHHTPVEFLRA